MSATDATALLATPPIRGYLHRLEDMLEQAASYLDGPVGAASRQTLAAGGKRLRPLLSYLAAPEAARESADLVRAGAAVELIHSATLVHDDVLDRAPTRRGRPTVWATSGEEVATATGDYLFARAFALLTETRDMAAVTELAECTVGLARGEAMQMQQARRPETTPEQYLERCTLKTGLLFATACSLGGRLGGLAADALARLRTYGTSLGLAFQIADDVLDCAGSPESTGKPIGTDLLDGTATLPLLLAARADAVVADALRRPVAPREVLPVLHRVAETSALGEARELAYDHVRRAEAALDDLDDTLDTRPLRAIARGVVDRES
jgi:geranylgeranyl pyrophosphate synthase